MRIFLLFLLTGCALGASAPGPPAAHTEDEVTAFLAVVPVLLEAVPPGTLQGRPLLVDLRSFVLAGSSVTGQDVSPALVRQAIGREFRDVPTAEAHVRRGEFVTETVDRGIHVRLGGVDRIGNSLQAILTYRYTDARGTVSAIGVTQLLIFLQKEGDRWRTMHVQTLLTS